jgi:hypothetical protein
MMSSDEPLNKGQGTMGREGDHSGDSSSGSSAQSSGCSPRNAGVIIRAYIEHVGVVGDAELTVNVKWPASSFCVQPCTKPDASTPRGDSQQVPANGPQASNFGLLYGEAVADPAPAGEYGAITPRAKPESEPAQGSLGSTTGPKA